MTSKVDNQHRWKCINEEINCDRVDLQKLKALSREHGGFLNNAIRSKVWPLILGINPYNIIDHRKFIAAHRDDSQVKVDVLRSLWGHEENKDWVSTLRNSRRKALSGIMMSALCRNPEFYYYQVIPRYFCSTNNTFAFD